MIYSFEIRTFFSESMSCFGKQIRNVDFSRKTKIFKSPARPRIFWKLIFWGHIRDQHIAKHQKSPGSHCGHKKVVITTHPTAYIGSPWPRQCNNLTRVGIVCRYSGFQMTYLCRIYAVANGAFHDRSPRHVHHDPFDLVKIFAPRLIYVPNVISVIFRFEGHTSHTI